MKKQAFEFKKFLIGFGYNSQREVVRALVDKGFYMEVQSATSYLNQIVNGKRQASQKFLNELEKLSIDSTKFTELIQTINEVNPEQNSELYSLEKEADKLYTIFREALSNKEGFYEKNAMLLDFKSFTEKHTGEK